MEKLRTSMKEIFLRAQESSSRHQKCLDRLDESYKKANLNMFIEVFLYCLNKLLIQDVTINSVYIDRCLTFAAKFCVHVAFPRGSGSSETSDADDEETHPFLTAVVKKVLKYHNVDYVHVRSRACQFITILLKHIGEKAVDTDLCDMIQDVLLERIQDPKTTIRLLAITALERLQNPSDDRCPVVRAFLECLHDSQATVRKSAVESICPSNQTIPLIIERLLDADRNVRFAALAKCANLNPNFLMLEDRQKVALVGISETNKDVRKLFCVSLLPKWLSFYNSDYVKLFSALKLDADENDIQQTLHIYRSLLKILFESGNVLEKVEYLPLDDAKLVPLDKLNFEVAAYWNILCKQMQKEEDKGDEEYLSLVQPELLGFCRYIERIVKENLHRTMDQWESFDYRHVMIQLLEIAERYDLSDEVGRQSLKQLIVDMLVQPKLDPNLISKLVTILNKLSNSTTELIEELHQVIADIREPLVQLQPTDAELKERSFMTATVRVNLNVLKEQLEDPDVRDEPEKVDDINRQIETLTVQMEEIGGQPLGKRVRQARNDAETLAKCLDVLVSVLQLPCVTSVVDGLAELREELVEPLKTSIDPSLCWRVLKAGILFGILDKRYFLENRRRIIGLITLHRNTQQFDKSSLLVAIEGASDMVRLYGCDAFVENDQDGHSSQGSSARKGQRRRLYEQMEASSLNLENITFDFEYLSNVLVEILNSALSDVRLTAANALMKILLDGCAPPCPQLISKLILKWQCQTEADTKLQQLLGATLLEYAQKHANADSVCDAVIPTIKEIATAPVGSPLSYLDVDSTLHFLAVITSIKTDEDRATNSHKKLALSLCYSISVDPKARWVRMLSKMLLYLDVATVEVGELREVLRQAEEAKQDMKEKLRRKNVEKFINKLRSEIEFHTTEEEKENSAKITERNTTVLSNEAPGTSSNSRLSSTNEIPSTKRKKQRNRRSNGNSSEFAEETLLTVKETSSEIEASLLNEEEFSMIVPSQDVSTTQSKKKTVISETSSDSESNRASGGKRSSKKKSGSANFV